MPSTRQARGTAPLVKDIAGRLDQQPLGTLLERAQPVWLGLLYRTIAAQAPTHSLLQIADFEGLPHAELVGATLPASMEVGEVSAFYEFTLAHLDSVARKDAGQYFTPDDVARVMASFGRGGQRGVPTLRSIWLDPCCGIGNLSAAVLESQAGTPAARVEFLRDCLFLNDRDKLALQIATILLPFRADPLDTIGEAQQTVAALRAHSSHADLLGPSKDLVKEVRAAYPDRSVSPLHVIVNPPYLAGMQRPGFRTTSCGDLYAYSLDRLAEIADFLVSVTPASFLQGDSSRPLREVILSTWQNLDVFAFDNVPGNLFRGVKYGSDNSNKANSTRAAILVASGSLINLKTNTGGTASYAPRSAAPTTRSSQFLRWTTAQRPDLLEMAPLDGTHATQAIFLEQQLAPSAFSAEIFPKVGHDLGSLYTHVTTQWALPLHVNNPREIGRWIIKGPTPFSLTVPTSTRYFIPAIKRSISRGASRTLFFATADHRDRAYLLINSSLTYWWWRIQDAGLAVSMRTLESLPIPSVLWKDDGDVTPLTPDMSLLVSSLELSENVNLVVKKNSGRDNENVKHPAILLADLTAALVQPKDIPSDYLAKYKTKPKARQVLLKALAETHANDLYQARPGSQRFLPL